MIDAVNFAILIGAGLIVVSVFTSLISQRLGAPLLLIFLGIGLLAGEDGLLGIDFDDGSAAYFIGSLALAIILFDSGFETRLQSYRLAAAPALTLATVGVVFTAGLLGAAAHVLIGLDWIEAVMLGAIVASTDAAAVFFLLRVGGITLRERVRATLEIESGTNDPMAIFLTLTLVELAAAQDGLGGFGWELAWTFVQQMGLGLVFGLVGGIVIARLLNRLRDLDPGLYPIAALSMALVVFAATGMLGGSGFLAAYLAGLVAGNRRIRHAPRLRRFQVGMSWLAQIGMFLTLGLLATPSQFGVVALPAVLLALILIFVARPLAVWLCLLPFGFSGREIGFVGWVGLRGAVSILLAILPTIGGVQNGGVYFNVVFIMVLASLLIQGWTIGFAARRLRLVVPPRIGPVDRLELELPGDAGQEVVAYRIHADSPLSKGERIPRWARPHLIVRGDKTLKIHNAGSLQAGDHVYLFASPRQVELLDKIYAGPAVVEDRTFYGDFPLPADAKLGDLARQYGIVVDGADTEACIGDLLMREFNNRPELGDRMSLGPIDLVVRSLDDGGAVADVGIVLDPEGEAQPPVRAGWLGWLFRRGGPIA
ncbi:potassium/proton antiporter [Indioceanicola profundi]|uniref:potassium/proton antiporter n=1 Tax=Indioceanicola profundi TaxID=2220096 RepID=UPI000E6AD3B9|nr:potassium/proton antiporter [Indioceanicola profundi]